MHWINLNDRFFCVDYMQMFDWHDGILFIHILGRSVPERITDPDAELYLNLVKYIERKVAK